MEDTINDVTLTRSFSQLNKTIGGFSHPAEYMSASIFTCLTEERPLPQIVCMGLPV
jgi:hypothetical protein